MKSMEYKAVGKSVPRLDAREKAAGRAVFGADVVLPGMLHGKILRSPHPHARIIRIDTRKAQELPGVRVTATARDAPETMFGLNLPDERFFARDEVIYIGDEVAAVAAVDEKTAVEALSLIEVEYEPLPAVIDPFEAMSGSSPRARADAGSNICHHTETSVGDVSQGFDEADVICEETYHLPHQYHAFMETHNATAQWKDGRLTIWASHQSPKYLEQVTCQAFDLPPDGFRFLQTHMGGGFGGKTHMRVPLFAALLARLAGAPVRITLSRQEDFTAGMPGACLAIRIKMGVRSDGILTAKDVNIVADNGAFTALGLAVLEVATVCTDGLYRTKSLRATGDLVYTNKLSSSGLRGFGNPQMAFALESLMDTLAEALGIDPVELRLRNAAQPGEVTSRGWVIDSCGLSEAIRTAVRTTGWQNKHGKMKHLGRGIGMACAVHKSGISNVLPTGAAATVSVYQDGTVRVASSEGESGQGAGTIFAQIAAEELGVPIEDVFSEEFDSDATNFGVGVIGSRVTVIGGHAVRCAAVAARERLVKAAADKWQCAADEAHYAGGTIFNPRTEESMDVSEAASHYVEMTGGSRVSGEALYRPDGLTLDGNGKIGNYSLAYPFAAHVAEVEVDMETGQVKVLRLVAVHDAGQIINPMAAEGQLEGALVQGMGYALSEEYIFDEEGRILNPDFTNFRLPTYMDAPETRVLFTSTKDPHGPYGAKSLGEIALVPVAPAIANAIYDAVGVRMTRLPMSPERLYKALQDTRDH